MLRMRVPLVKPNVLGPERVSIPVPPRVRLLPSEAPLIGPENVVELLTVKVEEAARLIAVRPVKLNAPLPVKVGPEVMLRILPIVRVLPVVVFARVTAPVIDRGPVPKGASLPTLTMPVALTVVPLV